MRKVFCDKCEKVAKGDDYWMASFAYRVGGAISSLEFDPTKTMRMDLCNNCMGAITSLLAEFIAKKGD